MSNERTPSGEHDPLVFSPAVLDDPNMPAHLWGGLQAYIRKEPEYAYLKQTGALAQEASVFASYYPREAPDVAYYMWMCQQTVDNALTAGWDIVNPDVHRRERTWVAGLVQAANQADALTWRQLQQRMERFAEWYKIITEAAEGRTTLRQMIEQKQAWGLLPPDQRPPELPETITAEQVANDPTLLEAFLRQKAREQKLGDDR